MSAFKIEATPAISTLELRQGTLCSLAQPAVNLQTMSLLTYDYESLLTTISEFMKAGGSSHLTSKALKVVGASMNDKKIAEGLQNILGEYRAESSRIYKLMVLWAQTPSNIVPILLKLSSSCREQVVSSIFSNFLLTTSKGSLMRRFLPQLLSIVDQNRLFTSLTTAYHLHKEPFVTLILNSKQVASQSNELLSFVKRIASYGLQTTPDKLQILITNMSFQESAIEYLLQTLPNSSAVLVKYIRKAINHDNALAIHQGQSPVALLRKTALKEWLEQPGNYWKLIDRYYGGGSDKRQLVLQLGRSLSKEGLYSSTLSIHYLYRYFKAQYFDFEKEDDLLSKLQSHQPWIDIYKSISQSNCHDFFNLVAINVTQTIKHWKPIDPFACKIKNRDLQKVVQKVNKGYQMIRKEYLIRNKKIELVFSTLIVNIKASNTEIIVSFDNLRRHLEDNDPLRSFQEQYQPEEKTAQIAFQPKKDHNIIVEAHLVRLLKRSKQPVSIDWLSRETKYESRVIELAMKRLCNKDLAEVNENGERYSYLA